MRKNLLGAATLLFLAGCGGGGGDDSGGTLTPTVSATPLAINAGNYTAVAQESVATSSYVSGTGGLVTGAELASDRALLPLVLRQLNKLLQRAPGAAAVVVGAVSTELLPCSDGGNMAATVNDTNGNDQLDTGESLTLVAHDCVEAGATLNGQIGAVVRSLSGVPFGSVYSLGMDVSLSDLTVAMSAGTVTGNGAFTVDVAMTALDTGTIRTSASTLSLRGSYGGTAYQRTLSDFVEVETHSPLANGDYRVSAVVTGQFSSTALESKTVTLSTPSPLLALGSEDYPYAGQLLATGASGSRARLTAQDNANVLVELDANGDGSYESSTTRAWSQLF